MLQSVHEQVRAEQTALFGVDIYKNGGWTGDDDAQTMDLGHGLQLLGDLPNAVGQVGLDKAGVGVR